MAEARDKSEDGGTTYDNGCAEWLGYCDDGLITEEVYRVRKEELWELLQRRYDELKNDSPSV